MSVVHIDGSGPSPTRPYATCAAVFEGPLGALHSPVFVEHLDAISPNEAEFCGLLLALKKAREHGEKSLHVYADSKVMVGIVAGRYKARAPNLVARLAECRALIAELEKFNIQHIRRWKNKDADYYADHGPPLQ